MQDSLKSVNEACARLHVSRPTLYELLRSGKLGSVKIGKARRIPESEIAAFIERETSSLHEGPAADVAVNRLLQLAVRVAAREGLLEEVGGGEAP